MLGRPFKDFKNAPYPTGSITQYFGENPALYANTCSVPGFCLKGHNGLDLVAPWGTPLFAVEDGVVTEVKENPDGYGRHIRFRTAFKDGKQAEWTYGHLSSINVKVGQQLIKGDVIGNMGNTGFVVSSSNANGFWKFNPYLGTHLHLGKRYFNTKDQAENYLNGYFGSVDFVGELPDPINDDIVGFVSLVRTLLVKLQQAGIPLNR